MNHAEAKEVSRIARQRVREQGVRIPNLPRFPHVLHTVLTVLTGGMWGIVYMVHYHFSSRRRFNEQYQRDMLSQARRNIESRRMTGYAY